ncbi:g5015 [Coccomyxa elongata]
MISSEMTSIKVRNVHFTAQAQMNLLHGQRSTLTSRPRSLAHHQPIGQHSAPLKQRRKCRCTVHASTSGSASGMSSEDDTVPPVRRGAAIALPRFLNTPGKVFALAGFLKVLVVTLHTVPVGYSCPTGLTAAVTMIPFGLALVLLSRYLLERDFMRWTWSAPVLVLGGACLIWLNTALLPPRAPVQPRSSVNTAAEVRRVRQQTPSKHAPPSTAEANRMWEMYEKRAQEHSRAAAAQAK